MEIFKYLCLACRKKCDFLQKPKSKWRVKCPGCGKMKLQRQLNFSVKTDYRSVDYINSVAKKDTGKLTHS